ncbi:MAG: hypothetical protein IJ536_05005, partial [Acidaminococcaceae bacterium]|nr:hypothetical protein [Acidaminococcaceae bacterium]
MHEASYRKQVAGNKKRFLRKPKQEAMGKRRNVSELRNRRNMIKKGVRSWIWIIISVRCTC